MLVMWQEVCNPPTRSSQAAQCVRLSSLLLAVHILLDFLADQVEYRPPQNVCGG